MTRQWVQRRSSQPSASLSVATLAARHPIGRRDLGAVAIRRDALGAKPRSHLAISEPGDRYEREAERVADQVMRMPAAEAMVTGDQRPSVQRMCAECEDEMDTVHRTAHADAHVEDGVTSSVEVARRGAGRALSTSERAFFEPRFGHDFSNVRVHTDSHADTAARAVAARAYTQGTDIVFRSDAYVPNTNAGRRLLAHELTHVVQQGGYGRGHAPTIQRQQGGRATCSGTAKRETTASAKFCVNGRTTNVPDGMATFHYGGASDRCVPAELQDVPPFATALVQGGRFSQTLPANLTSIPGVARQFAVIAGPASCCITVQSGSCASTQK